jgi:hypothetical protein
MHTVVKGLILVAASSLPWTAQAALVDGNFLTYQGYSSTTGYTPYGNPVAYIGGTAGVGIPGVATPSATLSTSGNVVTIDFTSSFDVPACAPSVNCIEGGSISVAGQTVTSAAINLSASSSLFDSVTSPVIGAAQGVAFVQLQGLDVVSGDTLVFTLNATPVPLPAALPLLLSGMAGLGTLARRRRLSPA